MTLSDEMARETICRTASSNSSGDFPPPSLMPLGQHGVDFLKESDYIANLQSRVMRHGQHLAEYRRQTAALTGDFGGMVDIMAARDGKHRGQKNR